MSAPPGPSTTSRPPNSRSLDSEQSSCVSDQAMSGDERVALSSNPSPSADCSDHQNFTNQAVELARTLTGASGSAIAFRGEQGTICRARSGEGAPPLGAPVDASSGISKYCLDSGRALRCDDIANDGRVDPQISRAGGIRAVAIVPIRSDGEISGILEVFSGTPGIFTAQHLEILQQLANRVGAAATARKPLEPIAGAQSDAQLNAYPNINLLVEVTPAYRAFFRTLAGPAPRNSPALPAGPSNQLQGWDNVFIDSYIPWKQFLGSVLLHVVVVAMVAGLSEIWPRELDISPYPLRSAHITYYPISRSFRARESNRPATNVGRHPPSTTQVLRATRARQPGAPSDTRAVDARAANTRTDDGQKRQALTSPPPVLPMSAITRLQKPALPSASSLLPAPPASNGADARQSHLPNSLVVAPPPELSGVSGLQRERKDPSGASAVPPPPDVRGSMSRGGTIKGDRLMNASGGAAISIVPPPPSLTDRASLTYGTAGVGSQPGLQGVAPPPSVQGGGQIGGRARGISLGDGSSQVVPPAPSLESASNSVGGGKANSLAGGGSQGVPPPPSIQNGGNNGGAGGRTNSVAGTGSQVVPPPPSVGGSGNSGVGGRPGSLASAGAGTGTENALRPGSPNSAGNTETAGDKIANDVVVASVPEATANQVRPAPQDVQLRVIALAWAPPSTSYFTNFEVFLAEKQLSKAESQVIKLVYVFLPYQRRLSEFGTDNLKVRRLRVTRDPSCDESLMAMTWPEGENAPAGSHPTGDVPASATHDRNDALPCYRTTADDYRRAVSGNR